MATLEEKVLLDVQINAKDALHAYELLQKRIGELRAEQKQLADAGKENTTAFRTNEQAIKALTKRSQEYTKEIQNNVKVENEAKGSMQAMKAELSLATAAFNKLDRAARMEDMERGRKGLDSYSLRIKELTKELNAAEQELLNFRRNVGNYPSAFNGIGKSLTGLGANVGKSLMRMFGPFALAMTAINGVISAVKDGIGTISQFSSASSNLGAILGTSKDGIDQLTQSAKELGATTQYTAVQITELQTELAKLGFTQTEILDATSAVQNFATATGADLAGAAALCGSALRGFGLEAKDMDRVASVLAVSTTKSALSFEYLNNGLSTCAPVAKQFGFTIEDTTALLGQLANSGFDASSAATATRNIFLNLADSNGKLAQTLGEPIKSLDDLAPALQKLQEQGIDVATALELTDKRSVAAFATLLEGSGSVQELRDSITDCNEALDAMAKEKLDNLEGDVTLLFSAWDGLMLSFGGTEGILRPIVQWLTKVVTWIQGAWESVSGFTKNLYQKSAAIRGIMQAFVLNFKMVANGISLMWNSLINSLKAGAKIIEGIFTLNWDLIKQGWKEGAQGVVDNFSGFLEGVKDNLTDAYEEVFDYTPPPVKQKVEIETTEAETKAEPEATEDGVKVVDKEKEAQEAKKAAQEAENARKKAEAERKKAEAAAAKAQRDWESLLKQMDSLLAKSDEESAKVVERKYDQAIARAREAIKKMQEDGVVTDEEKQRIYELNEYIVKLEKEKHEQIIKVTREMAEKRIKIEEEAIKNQGMVALSEFTKTEREKNEILIEQSAKRIAVYQRELAATTDPRLRLELEEKIAKEQTAIREANIANIKSAEAEELTNAMLTSAQKYAIKKAYLEKELEAVRGNADEERRIQQELVEARAEMLSGLSSEIGKWGSSVTGIMSQVASLVESQSKKELTDYKEAQSEKRKELDKRLKNGLITEASYNAEVQRLDEETAQKEHEINVKNAKWQKAMAVMNATLAAAQAIIMSLAQSPVAYGPIPNPAGIASLALATTMGALQIAAAAATPLPTAGKGMLIEGASHAQGGVLINAEGGEAIINKKATARFLPLLSRINQSTGGVPLYGSGGIAGMRAMQSAMESSMNYEALAEACASTPVYVAVTDINEGQGRVARVVERTKY